MRKLLFLPLFSLLVTAPALMAQAKTLSVPQKYPTIQAAVDVAHSGDTVRVSAGTYHESVLISPSANGIHLTGNPGSILCGPGATDQNGVLTNGIFIDATGVTVSGLTVKNYAFGISTFTGGNSIISNTVIDNIIIGIDISTGTNVNTDPPLPPPTPTYIDHNTVTGTGFVGIDLDFSQNVMVTSNTVENNLRGIYITDGTINCMLALNEVNNNQEDGILLDFGSSNLITLNMALHNGVIDAEDDFGGNYWVLNLFGTTSGI